MRYLLGLFLSMVFSIDVTFAKYGIGAAAGHYYQNNTTSSGSSTYSFFEIIGIIILWFAGVMLAGIVLQYMQYIIIRMIKFIFNSFINLFR